MIVEVQTGKVKDESDIVRIDDIYEENRKFTIDNKRIWVAEVMVWLENQLSGY